MFTGLVQEIGTVRRCDRRGGYLRLQIAFDEGRGRLRRGDSMAVDGVCLTATEFGEGTFSADLSRDTQRDSTLGAARPGRRVNLERPLRPSDPLGGHIVLGHVDGVGRLRRLRSTTAGLEITIAAPPVVESLLVEKGSIAIDGVSLTVGEVKGDGFSIFLIPETQDRTTLAERRVGDEVNLEADYLAKLVRKFVTGGAGKGGLYPGLRLED